MTTLFKTHKMLKTSLIFGFPSSDSVSILILVSVIKTVDTHKKYCFQYQKLNFLVNKKNQH